MSLIGGKSKDGKFAIAREAKPLADALHEAYKNPDDYLPKNPTYSIAKSPISKYLYSLSLPDKSDVIKEFMAKI